MKRPYVKYVWLVWGCVLVLFAAMLLTNKGSAPSASPSGETKVYISYGQSRSPSPAKSAAASPSVKLSPSPSAGPSGGDVAVYVTRTGSKYHKSGCQYLRQSKIATTLSEAKADGYTACSRCGPPK